MSSLINRRAVMTLYSNDLCPYSHRVRFVLAEKGVAVVDVLHIDLENKPEDLLDLNPYGTVPTLLDRDLILFDSGIIAEYLDERFPHPPLLPVYPVARAKMRMLMYRINRDWYPYMKQIVHGKGQEVITARKELAASLTSVARLFSEMPYFLSEDFSLVDCYLAPLLWRLPSLGVELPAQAKPIQTYMKKLFARDGFQASLSMPERELRAA